MRGGSRGNQRHSLVSETAINTRRTHVNGMDGSHCAGSVESVSHTYFTLNFGCILSTSTVSETAAYGAVSENISCATPTFKAASTRSSAAFACQIVLKPTEYGIYKISKVYKILITVEVVDRTTYFQPTVSGQRTLVLSNLVSIQDSIIFSI
jgi:hypothetical protein